MTACQTQNNHNIATAENDSFTIAETSFVPTDSNQFYFPLEVLRDSALYLGKDTFENTWYSQHLFAMREPIIYMVKDIS